ncbi:hypothetical protein M413DRAFT_392440 [Hebeloma cylindrosporum]|uniref:Uncharacterized protein n=1 Tax=Hebeloma cylindrosporum TaxID=76867 RepID=A0A0C3CH56_HEBCY|nr:hypothetical protein M413DRAFT_392440 [Hebeloma cylindrosporum h7]
MAGSAWITAHQAHVDRTFLGPMQEPAQLVTTMDDKSANLARFQVGLATWAFNVIPTLGGNIGPPVPGHLRATGGRKNK